LSRSGPQEASPREIEKVGARDLIDKPQYLLVEIVRLSEEEKQRFVELLIEHGIIAQERLNKAHANIEQRMREEKETAQARLKKENERLKAIRQSDAVYSRLWSRNDTDAIDSYAIEEWLQSQPTEELSILRSHLTDNTHRLNSAYNYKIKYAIAMLDAELGKRQR
jgi:hypothetical protein